MCDKRPEAEIYMYEKKLEMTQISHIYPEEMYTCEKIVKYNQTSIR